MDQQNASANGSNNTIIQVMGSHNVIGAACLTLIPWRRRVRTAKQDIDILKPQCQAVPLVGRDKDQAFLREWLQGSGIRVTAVVGRGGSGKTRLALDLLQHLPKGWDGGWLEREEAIRFVGVKNLSTWGWQRPTLIVVDYAALLGPTLKEWLAALVDHEAANTPEAHPPLRILLLERHADEKTGWYHDLADDTEHGESARELLQPPKPREITPIDSPELRRAILDAGMKVAAGLAQKPCPEVPPPGQNPGFDQNLSRATWNDPLLLLMAAVSGVDGSVHHALSLSRRELAIRVARRERDRLRNSAKDKVAYDLLPHLYACATLCGGLQREEAVVIAQQQLESVGKVYIGGPGEAVDDVARWQGTADRLKPLEPDLLGEALLLTIFGESETTGQEVIERLAPAASAGMAPVLIRLVQDFGYLSPEDTNDAQRTRWAKHSLLWVKALVHAGESDHNVLVNVYSSLPQSTLSLRPVAMEVTSALVARLHGTEYADTTEGRSLLAGWLNDLSVRQGDMGQREVALRSIEQAVTHYRELAGSNLEVFLPDLALSLNNLSNRQSAMGMREAALRSIVEGVTHYRELAGSNPEAFLPNLALSLTIFPFGRARWECARRPSTLFMRP